MQNLYIFMVYSSNMAATHSVTATWKEKTLLNYFLESCTGTCVYVKIVLKNIIFFSFS